MHRASGTLCALCLPKVGPAPGERATGHGIEKTADTNEALKVMSCCGEILAKQASRIQLFMGFAL